MGTGGRREREDEKVREDEREREEAKRASLTYIFNLANRKCGYLCRSKQNPIERNSVTNGVV
jgi:hypothetical protein